MSRKIIVISIIILIVVALVVYQSFIKEEKPKFELAKVEKGNVVQGVSETGKIIEGEAIKLSFKNSGQLEKIYVTIGEKVKSGDALAKIDSSNFYIQLQEAKSALSLAQAQLNKLLAGSSQEEIQLARTTILNAEVSLNDAKKNLENIKAQSTDNLQAAYRNALNVLDDAYLKAYNSFTVVDTVQRTYFIGSDQESVKVKEKKEEINSLIVKIKAYVDAAKANYEDEKIDLALLEAEKNLNIIFNNLGEIREICESENYKNIVSSTNKTSLDNQRTYINTALTNVTGLRQTISSTKLTNQYNIDAAQAAVSTAEATMKTAQDKLAITLAKPRQADIDLNQAQVSQAEAQVKLIENQIQDSVLRSPIDGKIIDIKKRVGEMVQPLLQDVVFVLLPDAPFEVKVDIYEEDVVKLNIGNPVDIFLVSFPEKIFKGKVISINPAEKLVEGVVYYEITIAFNEIPEGVKPGMTADLAIKTASQENVLMIPEDAIQKKDGKTIVEVFKNKKAEEREIKTGLQGVDNMVEVISGLKEGEEVILR